MRFSHTRGVILWCAVFFSIAADASAQSGVPFARYQTFETPHFIVTFEAGLEDYARRAATRAEAAHGAAGARLWTSSARQDPAGHRRSGRHLQRIGDTYPTNRIVAFAHTPVEGELFYTDDPIELLATHELAHVFHLDEARRGWHVLRCVFGRSELTFPHVFDGSSLIEGLATFYESRLTDGGRVRGSRFPRDVAGGRARDDRARTWTKPNRIPAPGRSTVTTCSAASFSIISPTRYGAETPPAWMTRRAGSFWLDRFARSGGRRSLRRKEPVAGMERLDRG